MAWYDTGDEYRTHHDAFDAEEAGGAASIASAGNRAVTALGYLNTVAEVLTIPPAPQRPCRQRGRGRAYRAVTAVQGGETRLSRLGLEVAPRHGRLLLFENLMADGSRSEMATHSSAPFRPHGGDADRKWGALLSNVRICAPGVSSRRRHLAVQCSTCGFDSDRQRFSSTSRSFYRKP